MSRKEQYRSRNKKKAPAKRMEGSILSGRTTEMAGPIIPFPPERELIYAARFVVEDKIFTEINSGIEEVLKVLIQEQDARASDVERGFKRRRRYMQLEALAGRQIDMLGVKQLQESIGSIGVSNDGDEQIKWIKAQLVYQLMAEIDGAIEIVKGNQILKRHMPIISGKDDNDFDFNDFTIPRTPKPRK